MIDVTGLPEDQYAVFAIKYAGYTERTRNECFLFDDDHAAPNPIDFFVWLLVNKQRRILVDTGFDEVEAKSRGREVIAAPQAILSQMDIDLNSIDDVIVSHLHFDHAGCLNAYDTARFHIQAAEMEYATGPCMCHRPLKAPFTADHICDMVRHVYSGRVDFHEGAASPHPGIELVNLGGHSKGLQAVRVKTRSGWKVLASDAAHFFENYREKKLFPIVHNVEAMLNGFDWLKDQEKKGHAVIPGHDPLVLELYPEAFTNSGHSVVRID